ncbi:MAG: glycosyltransferase [Candidatus Nanohaloarchaea archaeon]
MGLTLCIPAYNEAAFIGDTVDDTVEYLHQLDSVEEFEVVVVDGGSEDSTPSIVKNRSEEQPEVHLIKIEGLLKGESIMECFSRSNSRFFIFMDADGATDITHLKEMMEGLEEYSIVVGSRRNPDRTFLRLVYSKAYNLIVKTVFGSKISDHQCGFKGFRSKDVEQLFEDLESRHWFWDTEMLIKAQRRDLSIREIPIRWQEKNGSNVNLFRDSLNFLGKIIELRYRLWRKKQ